MMSVFEHPRLPDGRHFDAANRKRTVKSGFTGEHWPHVPASKGFRAQFIDAHRLRRLSYRHTFTTGIRADGIRQEPGTAQTE